MVSTSCVGVSYQIASLGSGNHAPIQIIGNDQFTIENGVTGGSGTEEDPYIIENWIIENDGSASQGILINNTDVYFIIRNCIIRGFYSPEEWLRGVIFSKVTNGLIQDSNISESAIGISLESSSFIKIINCSCSDSPIYPEGYGIHIYKSINISISSTNCFNMCYGLNALYSHNISVRKSKFYNNIEYGMVSMEEPYLNFLIEDCNFSNNRYYGVILHGSFSSPQDSGTIIRNCSFLANGLQGNFIVSGLEIKYLLNTIIENCSFIENGLGIYVGEKSSDITIKNCSFIRNEQDGLQVAGAFMDLSFDPRVEISHCDFVENSCGLLFFATHRTKVHHCNFINNSDFGVSQLFCTSCITYNNFINNGWASTENFTCGAFIWSSFADLRYNYWEAPGGPNFSWVIPIRKSSTYKLIPIHTSENADTILLIKMGIVRYRQWLSEPVPDAGRQT
ncbi:MAG: right-handed parallel beta-helix repeat-containing protein [Candidatus Thermoplasmatota archaeon]|nr:right-handed parallel beta-helix repeat-containing protein [Candidatus Thermoplasmatota archaeon]